MRLLMIKHLCLTLVLLPAMAGAAEKDDSGMVTMVQGNVFLSNLQEKSKPAIAFMKVRSGDKLQLPKDARLQILYFDGGRQESWHGESQIEIGMLESKADKNAAPPEIKQLPSAVLQRLTNAPLMLSNIRNRTGMVMVRALAPEEKVQELDQSYAAMRRQAEAGDVTPELYLLSGLYEMKRYREMKGVLEEIQRRQPDNPEIMTISEHYAKIMEQKGLK